MGNARAGSRGSGSLVRGTDPRVAFIGRSKCF
jgi:hypothetical protein